MTPRCEAEVFLLAENRLLRDALVRLLCKKSDIRVLGAAPYASDVLDEIVNKAPNILVLDSTGLSLPNASLVSAIYDSLPNVRAVMVDMDADDEIFLRAVREGVVGYVLKDASAVEVTATIRAVAAGEAVCPSELSMTLFRFVSQQANTSSAAWGSDLGLSRREQQLVELLRARLTNKEIAAQLNLSEQTVKNHVHNILRKMGASDRQDVVKLCEDERLRSGLPNRV